MGEPDIDTASGATVGEPHSQRLLVLGGVLGVLAVAAIVVQLGVSWSLTAEYGTEDVGWVGGLLLAFWPALLVTSSWVVVRRGLRYSVRRWWVVLLGSWAALAIVTGVVEALA